MDKTAARFPKKIKKYLKDIDRKMFFGKKISVVFR
jgi:hypothetical protein